MDTHILKLLKNRKASRAFSNQPLSQETIKTLMEATQLSASCFNKQSWRFLFLNDEAGLKKGRTALSKGNSWASAAPLLVVGFSKPNLDCQLPDGREYYLFDLGLATQNLMLQATELNLIARPFAGFSPKKLKAEFNIPEEYEIYVMLAVGYEGNINELDEELQKKSQAQRTRKPLEHNFFLNKFEISEK